MSSDLRYGIDIGTTSVSGVAVAGDGKVVASSTVPHQADLPTNGNGVDEQDPDKLLSATLKVLHALRSLGERGSNPSNPSNFSNLSIGWTGQMHGVVAVDRDFNPLTPFVTWRDARRYGGEVMKRWVDEGLGGLGRVYKCLTAPGYVIAKLTGRCVIDPTFLESWHVTPGTVPVEWLPAVDELLMLGDNQAGVYAAQALHPGSAVVNIGTSGQLSVVVDENSESGRADLRVGRGRAGARPTQFDFSKVERRVYPGGKTLICRASLVGGQALAALRKRLDISWEELNERGLKGSRMDSVTEEILACVDGIVGDLFEGMDLTGVKTLVGVGNALVRNPVLRVALERRSGLKCAIPEIAEMAAYGAAVMSLSAEDLTSCVFAS